MHYLNKTHQKAEEKAVRKFEKLLTQIPAVLQNHKPSVIAWLEGELTLTAKSACELSAAKRIIRALK